MINAASNPYDQLIDQMIRLERRPQQALRDQKSTQQTLRATLSDFDRSLTALRTNVRGLQDAFANPFAARKATVPSGAGFSASASHRAAPGVHTVQVERLAAADTRVSQRLDSSGSTLRSFLTENGPQTFSIAVAAPTDDEPDRLVSIAVTFDPDLEGEPTDQSLLDAFRTAVSGAVNRAVADGDIERRHAPSISVVQETTASARLSLRAGQTGYDSRLHLTDSPGGLLAALGMAGTDVATGAGGGAVHALGTGPEDSALNARFSLDGLTLFRNTNEVSDAVRGVTLTLRTPGEAATFSVGSDQDAVTKTVEAFIKEYNAAVEFMARRTAVDASGTNRGPFAGDSAVQGLSRGMREDLMRDVAGQPEGLAALRDLGIEIERDGKLRLADRSRLTEAAGRDPEAVQRLFTGTDEPGGEGLAARIEGRLDRFLGSEGLLRTRRTGIDQSIRRLDTRIASWDARLEQREKQLRTQFNKLQETSMIVQNQFSQLAPFLFGGY